MYQLPLGWLVGKKYRSVDWSNTWWCYPSRRKAFSCSRDRWRSCQLNNQQMKMWAQEKLDFDMWMQETGVQLLLQKEMTTISRSRSQKNKTTNRTWQPKLQDLSVFKGAAHLFRISVLLLSHFGGGLQGFHSWKSNSSSCPPVTCLGSFPWSFKWTKALGPSLLATQAWRQFEASLAMKTGFYWLLQSGCAGTTPRRSLFDSSRAVVLPRTAGGDRSSSSIGNRTSSSPGIKFLNAQVCL